MRAQVAKNYIMKLTKPVEPEKPEQEFENSVLNFIQTNIREITDTNLQDEVVSEIMLIIFEYNKENYFKNNTFSNIHIYLSN